MNKLEENFKSLICGLNKISKKNFVQSCRMSTNVSKCQLHINYENYFSNNEKEIEISN